MGPEQQPGELNKGLTHCFLLTFKREEDRAVYLAHPAHKAFGAKLGPLVADALVIDFWVRIRLADRLPQPSDLERTPSKH